MNQRPRKCVVSVLSSPLPATPPKFSIWWVYKKVTENAYIWKACINFKLFFWGWHCGVAVKACGLHLYPTWASVQALGVPLAFQLPAAGLRKQWRTDQALGDLAPTWGAAGIPCSWFQPGPANERSLSLSLFLPLFVTCFSNKQF